MHFRPLPLLSAFAALALAILIGLGVWQLQRREEKHALLAEIAARAEAPPAPIEVVLVAGDDLAAHRRVTARGTFDHAKELYVYAPRSDGPARQGKKVVTPFNLATGGTILVDRGWVDEAWPRGDKSLPEPRGEVGVEGVLRPSARHGPFTPPFDAKTHMFFARESGEIAKTAGIDLKSRLILEETVRLGNPEPLTSVVDIPDNHLSYAITWFGLAIVLAVIYLRYHVVVGRLRFSR